MSKNSNHVVEPTVVDAITQVADAINGINAYDEKVGFCLDYLRMPLRQQAQAMQNVAAALFLLAVTQAKTDELREQVNKERLRAESLFYAVQPD